jgi:uncharacterized membrane protein
MMRRVSSVGPRPHLPRVAAHVPVAVFFVGAGALHFVAPRPYERIMPRALPAHRALVYASGAAEIAGGLGVLHPRTRGAAGWWLAATLAAVFPANVNMAVHAERFAPIPEALLWLRLPLQPVLVAWVRGATSRPSGLPRPAGWPSRPR